MTSSTIAPLPSRFSNNLTRRDWYIGVAVVVVAALLHAAIPRYEWRPVAEHPNVVIRIDRWRGRAELGLIDRAHVQWERMR